MKIDGNSNAAAQAVTNSAIAGKQARHVGTESSILQSSTGTADRTTFSTFNPSLPGMVSQAMSAPPVRQDKVNELRGAIASGSYQVDPNKIADAMVSEASSA